MLVLVGILEVRWESGDTDPAGEYTVFYIYIKESSRQVRRQSVLVI
jgi:hypothetical protein